MGSPTSSANITWSRASCIWTNHSVQGRVSAGLILTKRFPTLIKAVTESAAKLPDKIFEKALKQMADGDNDGAAESFILYLNSTPVGENPNRQRGERFLLEQYNIRHVFSPL